MEDSDDAILEKLTETISTAKACTSFAKMYSLALTEIHTTVSGVAPTHLLRPLLFRLGQDGILTRLHPHLLRALRSPVADDCLKLEMSPQLGDPPGRTYGEFSESVTRRLFGSDTLLRLRLILAIANFCWVRSFRILSLSPLQHILMQDLAPSPEMRSEYGEVKRHLLGIISHYILSVIVRQIGCVVHLLSGKPPNVQRLRVQYPIHHI